jgi:predicted Zn-dependent protease with MMP-like domain
LIWSTLAHCGAAVNVCAVDWPDGQAGACALAACLLSPKTGAMTEPTFADPLAWRTVKAPTLEAFEVLAETAFRRLPKKFRALCDGLVIRVEDFPAEDVLTELEAQSEFDLLGLFQGVGLPFRSESVSGQMPNMIWLYRRPILDYWAEHDEALGAIIAHVLVHEIGHHFGLSDEDMAAIEAEGR